MVASHETSKYQQQLCQYKSPTLAGSPTVCLEKAAVKDVPSKLSLCSPSSSSSFTGSLAQVADSTTRRENFTDITEKMGRSVTNKRNFSTYPSTTSSSSSFHEGGSGSGGGNDTTPADHKNQTPHQRHAVKSLMEKLKHFRPHHEDILRLESIKSVISALGVEEEGNAASSASNTLSDSALQSSSTQACTKATEPLRRSEHGDNGADKNFVTSKCTGGGAGKSLKYNNSMISSDSSSAGISSRSAGADPQETSPVTSSVVYAKQSFTALIQNFEHFYKRVAKKYFFMLRPRTPSKSNFFGVFFSILAFIFYYELHTINGFSRLWLKWENVDLSSVECTIESPNLAMELFRPPVSCAICHDVKSVDRVSGISPAEFERVYAYTGRPVIVTDAMNNWTALSSFSFEFFKGIYSEGSRSLVHLDEDCLFFPYQTEFGSLAEVFNMTKERFQRSWYIGWSNCDAETSHILRHHYQRPYFLPETAESTHADWIFMGTPGHGAHMHIDHVINPSWQGQIKGFKRWYLQPPPECLYECHSFQVDVHPGDIIVLDTNKWYHQTEILPGENSITIGSEYD